MPTSGARETANGERRTLNSKRRTANARIPSATHRTTDTCDRSLVYNLRTRSLQIVCVVQRAIIHLDMDCFYAAIEVRDKPPWAGNPVAVGGARDRRGVLTTCNYEARKSAIRSAMPTFQALQRCPHLIVMPTRFDVYRRESQESGKSSIDLRHWSSRSRLTRHFSMFPLTTVIRKHLPTSFDNSFFSKRSSPRRQESHQIRCWPRSQATLTSRTASLLFAKRKSAHSCASFQSENSGA